MKYRSSAALRRALEDRLGASSRETHVALVRLRRRVVFERLVGSCTSELWMPSGSTSTPTGSSSPLPEPEQLATDGGGTPTWRIKVRVQLAGKLFDTVQLDVSPRQHELDRADRIALPNLLAFAGVPAPVVEVVDVHRHAAEKVHAMLRDYGERENSRVRDLVDLVAMIEHQILDPVAVASCVIDVFAERDSHVGTAIGPPARLRRRDEH